MAALGAALSIAVVVIVAVVSGPDSAKVTTVNTVSSTQTLPTPFGEWRWHHHHHHRPPTSSPGTPTATPVTPRPSTVATTTTSAPVNTTGGIPITKGGFPSALNTGVTKGTNLKRIDGDLKVTKSGTLITGVDVQGSLIVDADNVTIKDTRVRCAGVNDWCVSMGGRNGVLSNTEIGGGTTGDTYNNTAVGVWTGGDTGSAVSTRIVAVNIHHLMHGLRVDGSSTIQDSYIHDLSYADGVHSDGAFNSAGANVVYKHNTFVGGNNSLIFMQPLGGSPIKNILIENNDFVAETVRGEVPSYAIGVDRSVTGVSVVNNIFSTGPWQVGPGSENYPWSAWSGNTYAAGLTPNSIDKLVGGAAQVPKP